MTAWITHTHSLSHSPACILLHTHTHTEAQSRVVSSVASTIRPCGVVLITPMNISTSTQGTLSARMYTHMKRDEIQIVIEVWMDGQRKQEESRVCLKS